MLKVLSSILCDLDLKVKAIGQKVGICDGVPSTSALVLFIFANTHRLEKYLNLEGFLEKSLKIKSALKRTGKSPKSLEMSLNSTIFCRTYHC